MAQKVQVVLVDDLDGGHAEETLTFSLDGVSYEIDLSHDNAAQFRDAMAPYVGHGRRIGGSRRTSSRSAGRAPGSPDPAEVIEVNERGRISAELMSRFLAARA